MRVTPFLALALVLLIGLKRDEKQLDGLFAKQPWTYRDVVILFVVLTAASAIPPPRTDSWSRAAVVTEVLAVQAAVIMAGIAFVVGVERRASLTMLGLAVKNSCYHVAWSTQIVMSVFGTMMMIVLPLKSARPVAGPPSFLPGPPVPGSRLDELLGAAPQRLLVAASFYAVVIFFAPLAEELLFRGFIFAPLARKLGYSGAAFGSATLWALGHSRSFAYAVSILLMGLFYASLYRRTQSLFPSLAFHAAVNAAAMGFDLLSGLDRPGVLAVLLPTAALGTATVARCVVVKNRPVDPSGRFAYFG